MGVHPQRRHLDSARPQADRQGRLHADRARDLGRAVRGWQLCPGRGLRRQLGRRSGMGIYPQRRHLDPTGVEACRRRSCWQKPPGSLGGAVRRWQHRPCGRVRRQLACRSRMGVHPQRRQLDPAGREAGWGRRCWRNPTRPLGRAVRRWQHRHRERAERRMGVHPQRGRLVAAGTKACRHRPGCRSGQARLLSRAVGLGEDRRRRFMDRQLGGWSASFAVSSPRSSGK